MTRAETSQAPAAISAPGIGRVREYLRGKSTNRRVLSAAVAVGAFGLAARLAMGAQDLVLAWRFGAGADMDTLVLAMAIPAFAWAVLGGAMESAFVPTYVRLKESDSGEAAAALFRSVARSLVCLLAACCLLLALALPWLGPRLAPAFDPSQLRLVTLLGWILIPTVLFRTLTSLGRALLNSHSRFAIPASAPILTPLAVVASLIAFRDRGIVAVAAGVALGSALELALVYWQAWRHGRIRGGKAGSQARQVWRQYTPMILGASLLAATTLVDQVTAARLGRGSLATLAFGGKLALVLAAFPAMALGTAIIPEYSRLIARHDWAGVRHTLATWRRLLWLVSIPVVGLLILCSPALVRILFERGAFTPEDTARVASVQAIYLLQVPFYVAGVVGARLLSALLWNDAQLAIAAASLTLKVGLNILLAPRLGVAGIALATSLMYAASYLAIHLCLSRRLARESAR